MESIIRQDITEKDKKFAQECINCALCRDPQKQGGMPLWSVRLIERFCRNRPGYEKVYGIKAHEPRPA